ncbi:MAG: hypothetical protein ACXWKH_05900 [Limisphaerales bacterium]
MLYHEAKRQRKPMTRLTNNLLGSTLRGTDSWRQAKSAMVLKEDPPPYKHQLRSESPT